MQKYVFIYIYIILTIVPEATETSVNNNVW